MMFVPSIMLCSSLALCSERLRLEVSGFLYTRYTLLDLTDFSLIFFPQQNKEIMNVHELIFFFHQVVKRAVASQKDQPEAVERAEKFRQKYRHKLQTLRHQPL